LNRIQPYATARARPCPLSGQSGLNKPMPGLKLASLVLLCSTMGAAAEMTDSTAMELGYSVAAISEALQDPGTPGAMQAIINLGHDQRYYVMVRGWLMYQLQGDMSILQATQAQQQPALRARIDFIQQAIRAIDLE